MTLRVPMVWIGPPNGSPVQAAVEPLPDGDTIAPAVIGGANTGGSGAGTPVNGLVFSAVLNDLHANAIKGMAYGIDVTANTVIRLAGNTGNRFAGILLQNVSQPNGKTALFQNDGLVVMTAAEWALVTNDAAALTPGDIYFASEGSPGVLFHGALTSGHLATEIGTALSATSLLLMPVRPTTVP